MTDTELLARCTTVFPGHRARPPAEMFAAMAAWCDANGIAHDTYGDGALIQGFEARVAELLGFEAAVFCISGTLAQVTTLRLAADARGRAPVALHPTAHIFVHERSNYQLLGHFDALRTGEPYRPWTAADIVGIPDRLSAVALEIPMREIGGQLSSWDDLQDIKAHCRARGIHLHMDGARLWEAAAGYGRPVAEIAAGFDTVYTSLYKGIGGLGGAMLAGSREFVAQAAEWFKRQGGNVIHRSPYVVAAAMQFEQRLAAMPAYFERTRFLFDVLRDHPVLRTNPARPQANMLHIHLPVSRERALEIRRELARDHGIWPFNRVNHGVLPDTSFFELYVGDNLQVTPDGRVREAVALLAAAVERGIG
ncbi:beta-eliminating lyase-related protein [Telluria mixta]|uniref:Beta-eliminating lyase-related protein n=1 Tax=Telluria mixta TaxID=34071 RepID=A0ABT2C405_9BURK|nr:beta-eliminating lyase-related protein [Telluria mixta]MCS0632118.1 beta-eliminating lyase-related protein [Telluria mixta]WEM95208.1 beta-eliminating lyase-related protein [Telluria mixta]